jgi:hypothetical protein
MQVTLEKPVNRSATRPRTYARARLLLGVTAVGTIVTLAAAGLWDGAAHGRCTVSRGDGLTVNAAALVAFALLHLMVLAPFDFLGGYLLPRRYGRTAPGLANWLTAWVRGAAAHAAITAASACAVLAAGRAGGLPAAAAAVAAGLACRPLVASAVGKSRWRAPAATGPGGHGRRAPTKHHRPRRCRRGVRRRVRRPGRGGRPAGSAGPVARRVAARPAAGPACPPGRGTGPAAATAERSSGRRVQPHWLRRLRAAPRGRGDVGGRGGDHRALGSPCGRSPGCWCCRRRAGVALSPPTPRRWRRDPAGAPPATDPAAGPLPRRRAGPPRRGSRRSSTRSRPRPPASAAADAAGPDARGSPAAPAAARGVGPDGVGAVVAVRRPAGPGRPLLIAAGQSSGCSCRATNLGRGYRRTHSGDGGGGGRTCTFDRGRGERLARRPVPRPNWSGRLPQTNKSDVRNRLGGLTIP